MDVAVMAAPGDDRAGSSLREEESASPPYSNSNSNSNSNPLAMSSAANASAASSNTAGHTSFRRQRASRACETCHARKVRCDAASLGVPCTNCVAFKVDCKIPTPKRKRTTGATAHSRDSDSDRGEPEERSPAAPNTTTPFPSTTHFPAPVYHTREETPSHPSAEEAHNHKMEQVEQENMASYVNLVMKPKFTRAPITEAGRVAYLGESSNLTLLVHDRQNASDVVHYPLPEYARGSGARLTDLDNVEIDILHKRGAFLLPPRALCDELIDSYFEWVHPVVPVINRAKFMRQYQDARNPPSLLLLQAVLLAGSRVCRNPQLMDANGSITPASVTFYKRAKALYDANYEDDRVTIVQSLLLMGWYWEGPEDVTKNVFYWSRVATIVAQGSGMHRTVEGSQLSRADKRIWKRIWWTLFTRDRSVAVALGRPCAINLEDSDVEMLTEDDFIEDEPDHPSEFAPDPVHVQFFLQYVKLTEITGLVLAQQYSVAAKGRRQIAMDLTQSDMALADWLQNCPKAVYWETSRHHFWSALLHCNYYTTLCLLHRAHMPPSSSSRFPVDAAYPSRGIAFQAAAMITSIVEHLAAHDQLRYCPAFVVYSLFSALIMHVYQMRSPVPSIQQVTQERVRTCMTSLREISKVWTVGKMVSTLFECILGNRVLEERLQKAPGKRPQKFMLRGLAVHPTLPPPPPPPLPPPAAAGCLDNHQQRPAGQNQKRKYDEMAMDSSVPPPQPLESYERSRPQTPSMASAKLPEMVATNGTHGTYGTHSTHSTNNSHNNNTNTNININNHNGNGNSNGPMGPRRMASPPLPLQPPPRPPIPAVPLVAGSGDAFMGGTASRPHTRPQTPFNPSFSMPSTPPDLYLVTRTSPNLSQWEHFQPDQLFPENAIMPVFSTQLSPPPPPPVLPHSQPQPQPQLHAPAMTLGSEQQGAAAGRGEGGGGIDDRGMPPTSDQVPGATLHQTFQAGGVGGAGNAGDGGFWGAGTTGGIDAVMIDGLSPSDSWSSGSAAGQPVPSTLNVEDWFQFFGLNGDATNGLNLDLSMLDNTMS